MEKKTIRFCIWIWDRGVDDFVSFCLPSLMQPNNIPWLIQNGFPISLDFFTLAHDRARVEKLASDLQLQLRAMAPEAQVAATLSDLPETKRTTYEFYVAFFEAIVRVAVDTQSYVLFTFADMFFGDGSIRNIVVYGQKPGVTVSGLYLRVKQKPFMELMARHQAVTGSTTVSNARLVDMCLDTLIDGMEASIVDNDRNASHLTSGALRKMKKHFEGADVLLRVNPETVKVLKSNNASWLTEFEELTGKNILIKSDATLHPEQFDIQG